MENKLMTLEELNAKQWECVNPKFEFVKFIHVIEDKDTLCPYIFVCKENDREFVENLTKDFKISTFNKNPFVREVNTKPQEELTFTFIVWEKGKNIPREIVQYNDLDAFKKFVNAIN